MSQRRMACLEELRPGDFRRILRAVPRLAQFPFKRMWVDYDEEADAIYLGFRKHQHATDSEMRDDGIVVHRRGKQIVGLTILDASTR